MVEAMKLLWIALVLVMSAEAQAKDYELDPRKGFTLYSFDTSVLKQGDTISLKTGFHGPCVGKSFPDGVTIRAAEGEHPIVVALHISGCNGLTADGLILTSSFGNWRNDQGKGIVSITGGVGHTIRNCMIFSVPNAGLWSDEDWETLPSNGIVLNHCKGATIERNRMWILRDAIVLNHSTAKLSSNEVTQTRSK